MKPTRYFVEYWDSKLVADARAGPQGDDFDPINVTMAKDFASLKEAQRFARERQKLFEGPRLCERYNFQDVTPAGDPPGLLWDFEYRVIED